MTIWAFQDPKGYPNSAKYVADALGKGESRFGWGYVPTADLRVLKDKAWQKMSKKEQNCWSQAQFLLGIKPDDWVVHVNIPSYGECTAAQVTGEYRFDLDPNLGDFGHCFPVDLSTKITFDRNDPSIHPRVNLRPRKRYGRVYCEDEFFESLKALKAGGVAVEEGDTKEKVFLRKEISVPLRTISELIHRSHRAKTLEYLVREIFEKIPGVTSVKVNGSGWGTDYGADVIVHYETGLPFADLKKSEILVVQVKSYIECRTHRAARPRS